MSRKEFEKFDAPGLWHTVRLLGGLCVLVCARDVGATPPGQYRLPLRATQVTSDAPGVDFSGIVDEQLDIGDPPSAHAATGWKDPAVYQRKFPIRAVIDLEAETPLAALWIYDANNTGDVGIHVGRPGAWREVATYDCRRYQAWAAISLDTATRYVMLEIRSPGAIFHEVALDAYSPRGWKAVQEAKAEAERQAAKRQAALRRAREEALRRPLVELPPFGTVSLVDRVECGASDPGHDLRSSPAEAVRIETILGRPCRVLSPTNDQCAHVTFRLGRHKLLRPGGAYVLAVEYPEDAPRSMVVINTGNETARGFHTGVTVGDAMHPKYVDNFVESLRVPLSGKWETWTMLFWLHDRFPELGLVRGTSRPRPLTPDDGFDVTIAQFSAGNIPRSHGAAVGRISLYEVVDPDKLALPIRFPPADLPRRRLFWREEMADGVIEGKKASDRGLDRPLEWYRHKAELMRFLGINTYTKDLLEFGACQHWDSSAYGGNKWVYFNHDAKELWGQIVALMGQYGFDLLPYYEYSGSKGEAGLGPQRRAKPLTRDDAYTHIPWIESANADLTDPDTYADFQKMLDLTVIAWQDKARFCGIWIRPRSQLPVGFGPATLRRFASEANHQVPVTREQLKADDALYARYLAWWNAKRRDFLVTMRDYLRQKGIRDAFVLFTGCAAEPGRGFGDFQPRFFTDSPDVWKPVLEQPEHRPPLGRTWQILTPDQVAEQDLYLKALLAPGATWGGWEVHHANPADDPQTYHSVDGVLLSYAFHRLFTVNSPKTLDLFRAPAGLALVRHYPLNENMMFDAQDQEKLGYFVADVERAGPACMQAEAVAMANGDPTMIGYLCGGNYARGFPQAVRDFHANFLALPALPSRRLAEASSDPAVVVRAIDTEKHGTYLAVVNTAWSARLRAQITLPGSGDVTALATNTTLPRSGNAILLDLQPYQLIALHVDGRLATR